MTPQPRPSPAGLFFAHSAHPCYNPSTMRNDNILRIIATDLPVILRQLDTNDATLRSAARQRLRDFAEMTAPWRGAMGRRTSRRGLLRGAGATFAALSFKHDD